MSKILVICIILSKFHFLKTVTGNYDTQHIFDTHRYVPLLEEKVLPGTEVYKELQNIFCSDPKFFTVIVNIFYTFFGQKSS